MSNKRHIGKREGIKREYKKMLKQHPLGWESSSFDVFCTLLDMSRDDLKIFMLEINDRAEELGKPPPLMFTDKVVLCDSSFLAALREMGYSGEEPFVDALLSAMKANE